MGLYIKEFQKYVAATLASISNICEMLDYLGNMYVLVLSTQFHEILQLYKGKYY